MRTRRSTPTPAPTPDRTFVPTTAPVDLVEGELEDHDRGLAFDIGTLVGRRRALGLLAAGAGAMALAACGSSSSDGSTATTTAGATTSSGSSSSDTAAAASDGTTEIPEETGGPFPADGTNGPDVLTADGIVRRDITTSFGELSGTAEGIPMTVKLKLLDVSSGGSVLAGGAVYLWHCTREGGYSLYSEGVTDQNFLRGVQGADDGGELSFTSIWPAAYDGRWPHIHFEVYPSLNDASSASGKLRTSQIALPEEVCDAVYATEGYEASVGNLARTSLDTDMVFSDGYASQVPAWEGSVEEGYTITLDVGV